MSWIDPLKIVSELAHKAIRNFISAFRAFEPAVVAHLCGSAVQRVVWANSPTDTVVIVSLHNTDLPLALIRIAIGIIDAI